MYWNVFSGATVLITGHTGFKGSWLSIYLTQLGAKVIGYALPPATQPNLFDLAKLKDMVEHIEGDIRDSEHIRAVCKRHQPDFVFHLAAQPLVIESYRRPRETFDVNVLGTLSVLDAVREMDHPCTVVAITTDKVYENREWVHGYRETDPLGGYDPYSASKAAMEIALASYRSSFFHPDKISEHGIRLASARAGNVIGGGDWATDRIIPDAIRALSANKPILVRNPSSIRPWQHVLEPLSGYLVLAAKLALEGAPFATAYNFGPLTTENYTVSQLMDAVVAAWGSGEWQAVGSNQAQHEAGKLRLSIDKAVSELGWSPVWDFARTIERTVGWYKKVLPSESAGTAYSACLDDIKTYAVQAVPKSLSWTAS